MKTRKIYTKMAVDAKTREAVRKEVYTKYVESFQYTLATRDLTDAMADAVIAALGIIVEEK